MWIEKIVTLTKLSHSTSYAFLSRYNGLHYKVSDLRNFYDNSNNYCQNDCIGIATEKRKINLVNIGIMIDITSF